MTSFSLHGAYDETDEDYPAPRYGHPKDRRPDLLQVQAGIAAAGDGGIPLYHRAYDGGAAEVSQVSGAMTALKKIAGPRTFLLIGDSKLISYDNVAAVTGQGCTFLAPASKTYVKAAELAACDLARATEVSYIAQRDERKDPGQRGRWHVLEDGRPFQIRNAKRKKTRPSRCAASSCTPAPAPAAPPPAAPRNSPAPATTWTAWPAASAAASTPTRKPLPNGSSRSRQPARPPLPALHRQHRPGGGAARGRGAGEADRSLAGRRQRRARETRPHLVARPGRHRRRSRHRRLVRAAHQPGRRITAAEVLLRYKGQEAVERRYGNLKGPLAVAPMFLNSNRRIAALITVISLALLIFCLIEREARRNLAPETKIDGLYNRQPARPTGRLILTALAGLQLIPATATSPAQITRPSPVQARLLELLGVDPTRPP